MTHKYWRKWDEWKKGKSTPHPPVPTENYEGGVDLPYERRGIRKPKHAPAYDAYNPLTDLDTSRENRG